MDIKNQISVERSKSKVEPFSNDGVLYKGYQIWTTKAPSVLEDPSLVFSRCEVLPGSTNTLLRCRELDVSKNSVFTIDSQYAYNCNVDINELAYKDIGLIPHKNLPCVLDFLKKRYLSGCIYTFADPLLIVLNPFKNLNNTTQKVIEAFRREGDINDLPPHVFSIARNAVENLHLYNTSQTIVVSGESGAGKTEASKHIMQYLAFTSVKNSETKIQTAVLSANPILEAFGNAKTVDPHVGIQNGYIQNFLLETLRVFHQYHNERSYHVFYQLIKGSSAEVKNKYHLLSLKDYQILNTSCLEIPNVNDELEWQNVLTAFQSLNFTEEEYDAVYSILSAILLLGNVKIRGGDVAKLADDSRDTFRHVCQLLHLDEQLMEDGLCVKISVAGHDVIRGYWNEADANVLKESLGKALYEKLFDWLVARINVTISPAEGFRQFIAMLDIFGFEVFDHNSLEQLFINITNELLQNLFIEIVFAKEKALYASEGVATNDLVWTSNEEIINLLINKKNSFMTCLEDQCIAPGGTDEKFVSSAYKSLKGKLFGPAKVMPFENFVVTHTIGPIQYSAKNFLKKNKDILRSELVNVIQNSTNANVRDLFKNVVVQRGKLAKGQLNGSRFLKHLEDMISIIKETQVHFIRCVKPNETKAPLEFNAAKVLVQLSALSVMEALRLRNFGYSYRQPFDVFVKQFRFLDLGVSTTQEARVAAQQLLEKANIPSSKYKFGRNMIFIKHGTVKQLLRRQRDIMSRWDPMVAVLEAMILKKNISHTLQEMLPGLKRFQANARSGALFLVTRDAGQMFKK